MSAPDTRHARCRCAVVAFDTSEPIRWAASGTRELAGTEGAGTVEHGLLELDYRLP